MSLELQVTEELKTAMRAKDAKTLTALRAIKSAFQLLNTSGEPITEDLRLKALQKMVKQRNDVSVIYKEQNRTDLYEVEVFEIGVIEKFLPKKLSDAEIENEVKATIAETGASSIKDMGKVMGILNKKLAGQADGKTISDFIKKALA